LSDPTERFTDRVRDYVKYRPSYPASLVPLLRDELDLRPNAVVADVGSGTGILSSLFIEHGNVVYGVEPNGAMRYAAEESLESRRFHSVTGRAEATTLAARSVDGVVVGQAFHWFDASAARQEFSRILKPGGWVAVIWNNRRTIGTAFLVAYEQFLVRWCAQYADIRTRYADTESLEILFGPAGYRRRSLATRQVFDYEGLRGRLLSSSYAPQADDPLQPAMLRNLRRLFEEHREQELVRFDYDTEVYFGRLSSIPVS
jgi:SAM-dependent methyltransferase